MRQHKICFGKKKGFLFPFLLIIFCLFSFTGTSLAKIDSVDLPKKEKTKTSADFVIKNGALMVFSGPLRFSNELLGGPDKNSPSNLNESLLTPNPLNLSKTASQNYYLRPLRGGIKTQDLHGYNGIDFADVLGTPIYAAAAGEVILSKLDGWNDGYGAYLIIAHQNNTKTLYAHLNEIFAKEGEMVLQGDLIATLGNSGKTTGPHLHFEVRGAENPF